MNKNNNNYIKINMIVLITIFKLVVIIILVVLLLPIMIIKTTLLIAITEIKPKQHQMLPVETVRVYGRDVCCCCVVLATEASVVAA